jgi:hypothetical protein
VTVRVPVETVMVPMEIVRVPIETVRCPYRPSVSIVTVRVPWRLSGFHRDCQGSMETVRLP